MKQRPTVVFASSRLLLIAAISIFKIWFVTAQIISINTPPTAQDLSISVVANYSGAVHLAGSDVEGTPLTFQISSPPSHGTLSGTPPDLTYTPQTNFIGLDSFTYFSYDGLTNSEAATVSIAVKNGVSINNVALAEGNSGRTNAIFTVSLSAPPTETIVVNYKTVNATALAGSDFQPTNGSLVFTAGSSQQKTITVPILGDRLFEPDEEFLIQLTATANAILVNSAGRGIILNDDPSLGTATLTPDLAVLKMHERLAYSLTWTHPERWRLLNTIDFLIADEEGVTLAIRWKERENTFSFFDPRTGKFTHTAVVGSHKRFETPEIVMYLEDSDTMDSAPIGTSVTIHYSLSFKPKATGRTYSVEVFATDDSGNEQGFDQLGVLTVLKK